MFRLSLLENLHQKIDLWSASSEPFKIEYVTSQSQKYLSQIKKSTENETEKAPVSIAYNLQKTNLSHTQ